MKKRNLLLLIIICILSICAFSGLLVYAFNLQMEKDLKDNATSQNITENTYKSEDEMADLTDGPTPSTAPDVNKSSNSDVENSSLVTPSTAVTVSPTPVAVTSGQTEALSPVVLAFAGDVNLDENYYPAAKYDSEGGDINKCLSPDLLEEMNSADVMMLNNEFAYSTRGTKTPDKSFTFRADPSRVEILEKMGVDIVSLANNHALDYGPDALEDTFDTLDEASIDYVGAGENLERAKEPVYYTVGGRKIAFLAASRVVFATDWYATEDGLGMIGTYDPSLILESIKEAKENSDYVVIFVHWGIERESYPADYERTLAQQYIDAGADAVIGCHPHVMQGFEYYKGKPIAYSLSNFWFNASTNKSALLKLCIDTDGSVKVQLRPVMNKNTYTYLLTKDTDKKDYFDFIRDISYNVSIDEDGYITESQ